MKNMLFFLLAAVIVASCSKNKDGIKIPERKILLARSISVSNTGAKSIVEYIHDDTGRTISVMSDRGTSSELAYNVTYDSQGNIAAIRYYTRGSNGSDYTYDSQNRLISRQGYYDDGGKASRSDYTYYGDRVEELLYDSADKLTNKYQYFYSPDKRNIVSEKRFLPSGELTSELTFTYNTSVRNVPTGMSGIRPNGSEHVQEKMVWVQHYNGGKTVTQTYDYKGNADGYPESMEYRSSEYPTSSWSYTYEYIIKEIKN